MPGVNRHKLLAFEALRWVNFTELGSENKGQIVEAFQKAVDGRAIGEPWCMAFVQFCLKQVDHLVRYMEWIPYATGGHELFSSEHCWTTWCKSPDYARHPTPFMGSVAIWKNVNNSSGHTGIVIKRGEKDGHFQTVEGNTSDSSLLSQREGDGVFLKTRTGNISDSLRLIGFLNPWPR